MSVMTTRGLPPIGSLDHLAPPPAPPVNRREYIVLGDGDDDSVISGRGNEEDGFSFSGIPPVYDAQSINVDDGRGASGNFDSGTYIDENRFVHCALDKGITTLAQAREVLRSLQDGKEPATFPLVSEQARFFRKTVEEMAVALSLTSAGKTGVIFTLDHGDSYGLLKAADGKLTLFVPPTMLTPVNVFDMESMPSLPFHPSDMCNYATYAKVEPNHQPAGTAVTATAATATSQKGKEELQPWATPVPVATATATATETPLAIPPNVPSIATRPLPADVPQSSVSLSPVKKPVPGKSASGGAAPHPVPVKKASALVQEEDDDNDDEEEDEPVPPPTKKRELPSATAAAAAAAGAAAEERSDEKRAKTDPKKKAAAAIATAAAAKKAASTPAPAEKK